MYHPNKDFLPKGEDLTYEILSGRVDRLYPNKPLRGVRKNRLTETYKSYELDWVNIAPIHQSTAIEIHEEAYGADYDWTFDTFEQKQVNPSIVYERYTIIRRRKDATPI